MSANPASAVEFQARTEPAPGDDTNGQMYTAVAAPVVDPAVPLEREAGRGVFGSLRNGLLGIASIVSRYRSEMALVESQYRNTWNGGRPDAKKSPAVSMPHSVSARILSEDGELLVEATMREDADGSALLRLHEPKPLPVKALVQTSEDEPARPAAIKWAGESSAIIEFI